MDTNWLSVVIEEYKTLREESLTSIKTQQSTLAFGTAALGLVLTKGFELWDKPPLPEIIFLGITPILCYLILYIWIGEVARMMRAGKFIAFLEDKVNSQFPTGPKALEWETWLRTPGLHTKSPQTTSNYFAILALFFSTAIISIGIGGIKIKNNDSLGLIGCVELVIFLFVFFRIASIGYRCMKS